MAIRNMDESEYIQFLFDAVYQVYDLEAVQYVSCRVLIRHSKKQP